MRARLTSSHFVGRVGELAELELALREAATRKPVVGLLGGESGVGKTRLVLEFERRIPGGVLALRGESVEQADGELPYAPLLGALRPLVRERHPALGALSPGSRAQLAALLPGLDDATPPDRHDASAQLKLFEAVIELLDLLSEQATPGADPRGHALGGPLDPDVRRVPGAQPPPGARDAPAHLPHRRVATAAIRCAHWSPSWSAWIGRAASTCLHSTATS